MGQYSSVQDKRQMRKSNGEITYCYNNTIVILIMYIAGMNYWYRR